MRILKVNDGYLAQITQHNANAIVDMLFIFRPKKIVHGYSVEGAIIALAPEIEVEVKKLEASGRKGVLNF